MTIQLLIAGAQKAGTTSLLDYLAAHPDVAEQRVAELSELSEASPDLGTERFERRWFSRASGVRVAKLAGFMYQPDAVAAFAEAYPDAHYVVLLRDPIDRAYSAYLHMRRTGQEPAKTFDEALSLGPSRFPVHDRRQLICDYVGLSDYLSALRGMWDKIDRDRIHIFDIEVVKRSPSCLAPITGHIGLDPAPLAGCLPRSNRTRKARSHAAARLLRHGGVLHSATRGALPGASRHRLRRMFRAINTADRPVPDMTPTAQSNLRAALTTPTAELRALLPENVGTTWSI